MSVRSAPEPRRGLRTPTPTQLRSYFCKVANSFRSYHPKHLKQNAKWNILATIRRMMMMIVMARRQSISLRVKVVTEGKFVSVMKFIWWSAKGLKSYLLSNIGFKMQNYTSLFWLVTVGVIRKFRVHAVKLCSDPGLMMYEQWTPTLSEQEHLPSPWEVQVVLLWPVRIKLDCLLTVPVNPNSLSFTCLMIILTVLHCDVVVPGLGALT